MAMQCPICSSNEHILITDRVRFGKKADVLKCRECSLIYLDQNSFSLPADFYEGEYHQTYLTHVEPSSLDPRAYYEKMLSATKPWADRINGLLTGKEVVLDFGCSTGHLMTLIKDKAKEVFGFEINKKEIEFCREALDLDVSGESLRACYGDETFDYITMIFVLEHIAQPVDLLISLKKYLKPDGKFIILVPNINDPLLNFYDIPEFTSFYYCVEHLFYYSPLTIKKFFDLTDLSGKIETIQEYPITNHLNWGYRRKPTDVIASRRSIPDIPLKGLDTIREWEKFWRDTDLRYKSFLQRQGFGDRIWCVVGKGS
jgi:2-polyprenyl-3-methyl-5-hydroxy-6-metoxy-1,4-benzoquinol methylase